MKNRPPAFQFYVKDWLTSKKRATMTLEQQAAYINLLSHCWDSDDCSLPDDEAELAALSELRDRWETAGAKVKLCFIPHPKHPGHLTNERLLKEFRSLVTYRRNKQRAGHIGGVKSGLSRRQHRANHSEADLQSCFDSASSKTQAKRSSSSSSSSSSSIKKKTKTLLFKSDDLNGQQVEVINPEQVRTLWNTIPGVKPCKKLGKTIRDRIHTRLKEYPSPEWWTELLQQVRTSDFLCGRTNGSQGPFSAPLTWILTPTNIDKLLAGNYDSISSNGHSAASVCTKRVQAPGERFLHPCGQPASPNSRTTEPRCAEHLREVTEPEELSLAVH